MISILGVNPTQWFSVYGKTYAWNYDTYKTNHKYQIMVNLWLSTKNNQRIKLSIQGMKFAIKFAFDSYKGPNVLAVSINHLYTLHCTKPCRWGYDMPNLKCIA